MTLLLTRPGHALEDPGADYVRFLRLVAMLDRHLPGNKPYRVCLAKSQRGYDGYTVVGVTQKMPWSVTLYGHNFYLVHIQGLQDSTLDSPLRVLTFLKSHLPKPCEETELHYG